VLAFGLGHGPVEFDQNLTGCDLVAVLNADRRDNSGLERLDGLGASSRDDLALRRRDDIDMAENRPHDCNREKQNNGGANQAAHRRCGRLKNLQRGRQELTAVSSRPHRGSPGFRRPSTGEASTDDMQPRLYLVKRGVTPCLFHQLVMGSILDQPAAFDGDDPVGMAYCRQPMGNNQYRPAIGNPAHIALDDVFALVVERTGRLVEDQNPRVCDQRSCDRDSLTLAPERLAPRSPTMVLYPSGSPRMNS